jgi:hypothetical protein
MGKTMTDWPWPSGLRLIAAAAKGYNGKSEQAGQ